MAKNLCARTRPDTDPYETWANDNGWRWLVLKKWQADDDKPYARWFCKVSSPFCPEGELGDVYVAEIKRHARRVEPSGCDEDGFYGPVNGEDRRRAREAAVALR